MGLTVTVGVRTVPVRAGWLGGRVRDGCGRAAAGERRACTRWASLAARSTTLSRVAHLTRSYQNTTFTNSTAHGILESLTTSGPVKVSLRLAEWSKRTHFPVGDRGTSWAPNNLADWTSHFGHWARPVWSSVTSKELILRWSIWPPRLLNCYTTEVALSSASSHAGPLQPAPHPNSASSCVPGATCPVRPLPPEVPFNGFVWQPLASSARGRCGMRQPYQQRLSEGGETRRHLRCKPTLADFSPTLGDFSPTLYISLLCCTFLSYTGGVLFYTLGFINRRSELPSTQEKYDCKRGIRQQRMFVPFDHRTISSDQWKRRLGFHRRHCLQATPSQPVQTLISRGAQVEDTCEQLHLSLHAVPVVPLTLPCIDWLSDKVHWQWSLHRLSQNSRSKKVYFFSNPLPEIQCGTQWETVA